MEIPKKKLFPQIPQVGIYFPCLSNSIHGILRYERLYGPWNISIYSFREDSRIAFPQPHDTGRVLRFGGEITPECFDGETPTVVLDPREEHLNFPHVEKMTRFVFDSESVGKLAAEYFLQKRFTHFAYIGFFFETNWSVWRRDGYIKRLREDGFEAFVYDSPRTKPRSQSRDEKKIARWLLELPHPIALFAANDEIGIYVMDICQQNGLRIPEDVAVLGVDNQEIVCQYHHPTLSSIETSIKECGFRYAQVLERLMRGEEEMGMVYSYTPTSVVSRQSTKIVCFEDPLVAQALEFIQTNFGTTIGVPDIVKFCNISRRTLETRFQKEVGHSILSEITRLRMEKLARLLRETNFPINELASLCGYLDDVYMGKVFHKNFHCSMSQYRKNSFDG